LNVAIASAIENGKLQRLRRGWFVATAATCAEHAKHQGRGGAFSYIHLAFLLSEETTSSLICTQE